MPSIIWAANKNNVDGSISKRVLTFLEKLQKDPSTPGLNIEPIVTSVDKRVRTGRVNDQYRAVLFELNAHGTQTFVYTGTFNHDDAIKIARTARLTFDPTTGIASLIQETERSAPVAEVAEVAEVVEDAAPAEPTLGERLDDLGYSRDYIAETFGVDADAINAVWELVDEDDLAKTLAAYPEWMSEVFIGLLAGMISDEVRADLALDEAAVAVEADKNSDDALIEGMQHPTAKSQFTIIGDDADELRRVVHNSTFVQWQVYLHPSQSKIVDRNYSGTGKITGGAGTGKTVVLVHRANRLITENPDASVMLTTYTRDLANSLKAQMNVMNPTYPEAQDLGQPGLWIGGVDQAIDRVIRTASTAALSDALSTVLGTNTVFKPGLLEREEDVWRTSISLANTELPEHIANPMFLKNEFEAVVLPERISSLAEYRRVARTGRGTPLSRQQRGHVWKIIDAFRAECVARQQLTYATRATVAADCLTTPLVNHALVDEGQDLHSGHWMFLRNLVAAGPNDIFIAEDAHQRIYGQRLSLRQFGLETRGRATSKLLRNYRTTEQNLDYALNVLRGEEWIDSNDDVESTDFQRSALQGPEPVVVQCESESEQIKVAAEHIRQWQEDAEAEGREHPVVGVLARTRKLVRVAVAQLNEHGIPATSTGHDGTPGTTVMTMHNAKGQEFTHVVLLGVDSQTLPLAYLTKGLGDVERNEQLQKERSLLYVAVSRARENVLITTGAQPSEFLPG